MELSSYCAYAAAAAAVLVCRTCLMLNTAGSTTLSTTAATANTITKNSVAAKRVCEPMWVQGKLSPAGSSDSSMKRPAMVTTSG